MIPSKIGRYKIVDELGRGGMAQVYLARDPLFDRPVAIKVIKGWFADDEKFRTRFRREARTIARLEHRAIVPVYDTGEDNEELYLVMRYMPGDSLRKQLDVDPIVPFPKALLTINRLAAALESAHRQGIIHRDIKPANVLLDNEGSPFLADFGIAHIDLESEILRETGETLETLHYIGSPFYMAPEQWKREPLGPYTDVYQLGIMLFEMVTGKRPFAEGPLGVLKQNHLNTPPPRATTLNNKLPSQFDQIFAKAMAKKPEERYQSPQELAKDLAQALQPETIKNRYQLNEELARGRLAKIYRAHDLFENQEIALKRLKHPLLRNSIMRQRYQKWAATLSNYQHPAVVPVYDMGEDDGKPYLTMPFIHGRTLSSRLRREGNLPVADVCDIAQQVALALDDIHNQQLAHGNIQPNKILIDKNENLFLTGLGLTQISEFTEVVIEEDAFIGASPYMAPEQWQGEPESAQTDIYQFGVTLFELLTGQRPFPGPTLTDYAQQHQTQQPPNVCAINPDLPPRFDHILGKALAKSPTNRYLTASELAYALVTTRTQHAVDIIITKAKQFYEMQSWEEAIIAFEEVLKIQPDNTDAQTYVRLAKEHQTKTAVYNRGLAAFNEQRWQDTVHYLHQVPEYKDSEDLLKTARRQIRLAEKYEAGLTAYEVKDWVTARNLFYEIDQIQPNYQNLSRLLPQTEQEIAHLLKQGELAASEERWEDTITTLEPIAEEVRAKSLLDVAEHNLKNGRSSTSSLRKWLIPVGIFSTLLLTLFILQQTKAINEFFATPQPTPLPSVAPAPKNILSATEADQCLRDMSIWVTHDQDESLFLKGEAEDPLMLLSQSTILDSVIELPSHCADLEKHLCLTWESTFGTINPSDCSQTVQYEPPVAGSDFITLNADISEQYPESDFDWDLIVPINIRE